MNDKACILFYVKYPEHGSVKTRLAEVIGDEHAVNLYKCFILDMLTMFGKVALHNGNMQICVCYTPESAEYDLRDWLGEEYIYWPQRGLDLGERMNQSFQQAFDQGFQKVVILGSDLPDVPASLVSQAFTALQQKEAVIGPADDGGYFLLGFRQNTFFPDVFQGITWSTPNVYHRTLKKMQQGGVNCFVLPAWKDIDDIADLQLFYRRNQDKDAHSANTLTYLRLITTLLKTS